MKRTLLALGATLLGTLVLTGPVGRAAADPTITLAVVGTGVGSYPAFDPTVSRYAVTTTAGTAGTVDVTAATTEPGAQVLVDGRPTSGPTTELTGLTPGEEISVIVAGATRHAYSLIYLPAGFPVLERTVAQPGRSGTDVGLTLSRWDGTTPNFDTIVDERGVPVWVAETQRIDLDLKQQPDGRLTVSRPLAPAPGGSATTVLDDQFRPTATTYRTVGLTNTDNHDSELLPDGTRLAIAYEPDAATSKLDSVIQEIDATGHVVWQWNSAPYAGETVDPSTDTTGDYAHINSVQMVEHRDVIASFRHLSSVFRIATVAHDGYQPGDVIWKLGGRDSTFSFPDDPLGGPCAQHSAREVSPDHVLLFDNGTNGLCVDPHDPTGPTVNRGYTRVSEYALDLQTDQASLVWSYTPPSYNAFFAGSATRLPGGDTLVGWAAATQAVSTEVDPGGTPVWTLVAHPDADGHTYFSYRAAPIDLPDRVAPAIDVTAPAPGEHYAYGATPEADFGCTDTGGSDLQRCGTTVLPGAALPSTPGIHTVTLQAVDGAGNKATVQRTYTVAGPPLPPAHFRPDLQVRAAGPTGWTGDNAYGAGQRVTLRIARRGHVATAWVLLQNDGNRVDDLALTAPSALRGFRVRYFLGRTDVTARVAAGRLVTRLAPGASTSVRVEILRERHTGPRRSADVRLRLDSAGSTAYDVAHLVARS